MLDWAAEEILELFNKPLILGVQLTKCFIADRGAESKPSPIPPLDAGWCSAAAAVPPELTEESRLDEINDN